MGESALNYHQIWARVEVHLLEFKSAKVRERRAVAESTSAVRWRPPSPNHYKINFDEAIFFNVGATGLGVVIRDSCGRVIGFLAKRVPLPTSTTTVEALACRRVLLFAKELACVDTAFERDAELIIKALLGREVRHLEYEHVIQDILVLAAEFRVCKFNHVKCLGNFVAHFLVRRSKSGNVL
ncbi:uncharacterized protein LOC112029003 [Quercus suber]|uniref:uncharacterized protein LOC112029003 n=1 Tax=Quercus suber TaxID=58331 RepID=UPI000CE1F67A|nr:uncharacterized protein LOC112029003 [Quercus suber]